MGLGAGGWGLGAGVGGQKEYWRQRRRDSGRDRFSEIILSISLILGEIERASEGGREGETGTH